MKTFAEDLQDAINYHGHFCAGQAIGVRMARMALRLHGIEDPKTFRDLVVYVECDRCLTDAIGTVTGCKLGRRSLKWMDYGKTAATFLNTATGKALRFYCKLKDKPPEDADKAAFFDKFSDEEMFSVETVKVHYSPEDLPGRPKSKAICSRCGEEVLDGRQVTREGAALCKACDGGAYYSPGGAA